MKTLYKRNKNGSIQKWAIEVIQQGFILLVLPRIKIQFGQLNGKLQTIEEEVSEGKQGRNLYEQAQFQECALIASKRDEGYKSLKDLGIVYNESLSNIATLTEMIDYHLPKDNTDASGNVKPMLAHPIKNDKKDNWYRVTYPIAGEPKLDGVRCLIFAKEIESNLFQTYSISREGKSYNFGTTLIRNKLVALFNDNPDIILDGELYVHGMPQNRISGAMRSGKYIPEVHDTMEYHVYDIVDNKKTYQERREVLQNLFIYYEGFIMGHMKYLASREEVDAYEIKCIEDGYEGIMLKSLNGLYEIGKRSYNNLKVKQFEEEEFIIVGYELGKRGVQDLIFHCETKDGKLFKPTAIGTIAEKQQYYQDLELDKFTNTKTIIGQLATVKFKFWSEYGIPNHCHVKGLRNYER